MTLEQQLRDLVAMSAERSAEDPAAEFFERLSDSKDDAEAVWAVVMLRLRAAAYALGYQASLCRELVDTGDTPGALNCLTFTAAMAEGFENAARSIIAPFLPEYLP